VVETAKNRGETVPIVAMKVLEERRPGPRAPRTEDHPMLPPPALEQAPQAPSRIGPVVAALLLHAGVLAAYLAIFHGDLSALVCAPRAKVGAWPFEDVRFGFPTGGYDGQFYYTIARNPWDLASDAHIDLPALRRARILYPVLAWLVTGGDPERLFWALPAINLLAIVGLAWIGATLARHYGRSPWWGLLLPLAVNAGLPLVRDLTDPLATLAVAGLLAAWLRRRSTTVLGLWAMAAVLSREQNVVIVAIVAVQCLADRSWRRAVVMALALAVWAGWTGFLWQHYGSLPSAPENVGRPFSGMYFRWTHPFDVTRRAPTHGVAIAVLTAQLATCLLLALLPTERTTRLVALAGVCLLMIAGPVLFQDTPTYLRVFTWLPLAIWLWTVQTRRNWAALVLLPSIFWPALHVFQTWSWLSRVAA
jgi:hypothetical protein